MPTPLLADETLTELSPALMFAVKAESREAGPVNAKAPTAAISEVVAALPPQSLFSATLIAPANNSILGSSSIPETPSVASDGPAARTINGFEPDVSLPPTT